MVRMFVAAALAALIFAGDAAANGPGPGPTVERYGWNPIFKGLFSKKKSGDCSSGNCGGGAVTPPPYGAPGGGPMPGTLVFPNHQFNRSPRDFFMWEK